MASRFSTRTTCTSTALPPACDDHFTVFVHSSSRLCSLLLLRSTWSCAHHDPPRNSWFFTFCSCSRALVRTLTGICVALIHASVFLCAIVLVDFFFSTPCALAVRLPPLQACLPLPVHTAALSGAVFDSSALVSFSASFPFAECSGRPGPPSYGPLLVPMAISTRRSTFRRTSHPARLFRFFSGVLLMSSLNFSHTVRFLFLARLCPHLPLVVPLLALYRRLFFFPFHHLGRLLMQTVSCSLTCRYSSLPTSHTTAL